MRSKDEILDKTKKVIEESKILFVKQRTDKSFRNCICNDTILTRGVGKIYYCKQKTQIDDSGKIKKLFTCDNDEWVQSCSEYLCKNCQEMCENEFNSIILNPSLCGRIFPKLSALLWVLNDGRSKDKDLTLDKIHGQEENENRKEKLGIIRSVLNSISCLWRKNKCIGSASQ